VLDEFLEAWKTNARITRLLVEAIDDEGMACTLSKRGGRGVLGQFAHLHNNRAWQLQKRAPDLAKSLRVYPAKQPPTRRQLLASLDASERAVTTFLREVFEGKPKRRGFRKGLPTTLAYLVAHESHHRGNILLTLKTCGHAVDKATAYSIWDWDRR
jgi:uncharacterized damage-inducible protein DinB